jgi:plasmid stabilization system protein ParE
MKVRILTSAFNDLADARAFYELQGEGLGDEFFDSVFSDIDSLALYGGIHPKILRHHRLLTRRFPYAVYYKMDADGAVTVFRVLDCRQDFAKTAHDLGSD